MNVVIENNSTLKEVSCRITNSVLKYLESQGFNTDAVVDGLPDPYSKEYLSDPLNWTTYEIRETVCRRAAELTHDDAVLFKVGLSTPVLNPLGGVESVIRKLTGPLMVYRLVPKYARLFDRIFRFKTVITGKNTATVLMTTEAPGYKPSKDSCYFAQGILAAIPTLWGLPPADIHEKSCMYKAAPGKFREAVQYEAEACVYEVQWQPLSSWYSRLRDNILGHMAPAVANFNELEQSLRHINQQNTELIARNKQLAAVREIAIGVDKVRTIDEALSLAVEQAREIEGIRFVIVQTLDETGEYITTPYYSKRRPSNVMDALKAIGFDPEKELGKSPTSNKLRFKLSKIKIAQDYLKNPRVRIISSLAELLDGALPRTLCEAIQTILRAKKLVLVPLLVDNKLWGNILFFLTKEVPTDILEMIGSHCAFALNNIINLNSLVSRNTELTASNKQLAAVREIAISVDKVRTIDEALALTVEHSREIEGIRMVLVQKMDDAHENVVTPYYSKFRSDTKSMIAAAKAVGFDPLKVLGKSPTSNKLRLPLSKLKVAQDYNKNPRVMVFTSLAELLAGVWPKTLCDAIQKIMGVKKFVIVPLMVEGESWGHILYFLSQEVPIDILEMIGGHCALAIKNIVNLDSLVSRNIELLANNKQLAAVREIAISVDKVMTIDEALTLTVEQLREIEGVRLVLVQKLDETGEYVTTPYYSKTRPESKNMVDAIKALGFDPEKELGKSPTSNKLRFRFSKLKAAQDYVRNPRVMVMPSLAELLDGIWPRTLCNAIQKILRVINIVIVPLMVEGKSWGNMLYFLSQEVPIDILEMIGGHCALAIKNIINLNNLELKNAELFILNRIANITSKSLDMETLLNDMAKEIILIYKAEAAAIYLSGGAGQPLKLAAECGIPEIMKKESSTISLDDIPMGKFFSSQDNIMSGTMDDYISRYPQFKKSVTKLTPSHYMTSILSFGEVRYGLVTVVRAGVKTFDEDEKSLLQSIANQLAVSLENSKLHSDVLRRAHEAEVARRSLEELFAKHEVTEEKLRESEERYRTIFESANDILILIDNKGKIVDVNDRVHDIAGYSRDEIIGNDFRSLSRMMTKKSLAILAKNYLKRIAGMNVPVYDVEMMIKSGERRIVQINAVGVRKEGKITGDLAILRDITGLKQAENNLKSQKVLIDRVLATIPNAVLLLNNSLKVIMANQAFYDLFKLKRNQVEKKSINDLIITPDIQQAITETLNGKGQKTSIEFRYSLKATEKILIMNVFAMKEENLLLVINDVTEEREKQERLYLTDRLASIGEMASGAAHQLNNPLTSIIGLSGLLVTQQMPQDFKDDLNSINSEAQRCAAVVRNLLTFARKHASQKEPVEVPNIVEDVLKLRARSSTMRTT